MKRCLRILYLSFILSISLTPFSLSTWATAQEADLVLVNGKIATMDRARPWVEAIAMKGERIISIGSIERAKQFMGRDTEVIDLEGKFAMPGLIEGHAHYIGLGQSKMMLNHASAKSWDDVVKQVEKAVERTPPGEWIIGRGWHQSKWTQAPEGNVDGYPSHQSLSKVSPNNPVLLTHASGHMNFANAYAMRLAGVDQATKPPAGGEILHDKSGAPIGVFRETAQGLITKAQRIDEAKKSVSERAEYFENAVRLAGEECLKFGITSFQDAGSSMSTVELLKAFAASDRLPVRLWVMIRDRNARMRGRLPAFKMIGFGNNRLTCRALKRSIDGALGPHGAWLLAPYSDLPTSSGLNTASVESVRETAELAVRNGFQMCIHAIGDRANREVLDIFEEKFKKYPSPIVRRWRVEHAQHLHPDDIGRFAELGVIASMQGVHCTSDAVFVPKRLGMRRSKEGAYVWKSLINSGAVVTNGTDAPVESIDPFASIYASVTRKLADGVTFFPEQVMTREQALRSYTIDCAYAAFEENLKGSLVAGKLADVVVLSNNLLECSDDEILSTQVEMTILGGKVVYKRRDSLQKK